MMIRNSSPSYLLQKYTDKLIASKKNTEEILSYIKTKFNIKKISADCGKYSSDIHITKINCLNSSKNGNLSYEKLNVVAYEIIEDERSILYYNEFKKSGLINESIYVILELETGYLNCNSNSLEKELFLYQGISDYDIKNKTPELFLYLRLLDENNP